ncbi:TonB-dependent receptor [Novosphingobium sp.]|uniref:TonB-dependent receptor n=1 Tax=Novosphingobium sp. TaxID=1874826 RepID=UPI002FDDD964
MAAASFMVPDGRRRRKSPVTFGRVLVVVGAGLVIAVVWNMLSWQSVSDRPNEMKTTAVILPPPPPPPPPPKPEVVEQPPEPKLAPPLEKPLDTPPPPQANNDPAPGDSALSAREGAGPSNYGLARGNGSGTMIGTRAGSGGDNGFGAYASLATAAIRLAAQSDRELARGRYTVRLIVSVDAEGRITDVRVVDGSGDSRRDDRLTRLLSGLQLSRRPPPGLPVMRIELNSRPGA